MGYQVAACLLCALLAARAAGAQDPPGPSAGGAAFGRSSDSDGLRIERLAATGYVEWLREGRATGLVLEAGRYAQGDWRRSFEGVGVHYADQARGTSLGWLVDAGVKRQGGRTLAVGEAEWSAEPRPGTRIAFVGGRGWVETAPALQAGVHAGLAGASVDQELGGGFTAVGFLAAQRFSDGNRRTHARARLIHATWPEAGITLQLRARHFTSRLDDAQGLYFNPPRYTEALVVVAMRRRWEGGWSVLAEAGTGRQYAGDEPRRPARLASASLVRVLEGGAVLKARAAYRRSASFGGPDYASRELALEAVIGF